MSNPTSHQTLDRKTGRTAIESALAYKEKPPPAKRHLKPKNPPQKKFVPRQDFADAPDAQQLHKLNARKKLPDMWSTQVGAFEDEDVKLTLKPNEVVPCVATKSLQAGGGQSHEDLITKMIVRRVTVTTDKIGHPDGLGFAEKERNLKSEMKRREVEDRKHEEERMKDIETEVDPLTGMLRPKRAQALGKRLVAVKDAEMELEAKGRDIFGREKLIIAPKQQSPEKKSVSQLEAEEGENGQGENPFLQERGARDHYEKLYKTAVKHQERPGQSQSSDFFGGGGAAIKKTGDRNKHVDPLGPHVDMEKAKAAVLLEKKRKETEGQELDILGQPLKYKTQQPSAHKKKMFPTDKAGVNLFEGGSVGGGMEPRALNLTEEKKKWLNALPSYIGAPPPLVRSAPAPTGDSCSCSSSESECEVSTKKERSGKKNPTMPTDDPTATMAYTETFANFYKSPLFATILHSSKGWGVRGIRIALREQDKDEDGAVNKSELRNALIKCGVELEDPELKKLISLAPANDTRNQMPLLLVPQFINILRQGATPSIKRMQLIKQCYRNVLKLTKKHSENLTLEDIESVMNFANHPTFQPHVKGSIRVVMAKFSSLWGRKVLRTSVISELVFTAYWHDMGASYGRDSDFQRMMKGMHHL